MSIRAFIALCAESEGFLSASLKPTVKALGSKTEFCPLQIPRVYVMLVKVNVLLLKVFSYHNQQRSNLSKLMVLG